MTTDFLTFSEQVHEELRAQGANVKIDGFADVVWVHMPGDIAFGIVEDGDEANYKVSVNAYTLEGNMLKGHPELFAAFILSVGASL